MSGLTRHGYTTNPEAGVQHLTARGQAARDADREQRRSGGFCVPRQHGDGHLQRGHRHADDRGDGPDDHGVGLRPRGDQYARDHAVRRVPDGPDAGTVHHNARLDERLQNANTAGITQYRYNDFPGCWGGLASQRSLAGTPSSSYYVFDMSGNTRALVASDGNTVQNTYLYDAYGNVLASTGSTAKPFQYGGEWGYYQDPVTGLTCDQWFINGYLWAECYNWRHKIVQCFVGGGDAGHQAAELAAFNNSEICVNLFVSNSCI